MSTVLCQLIPPLHLTPSRSWRLELSPVPRNPPISTYQVKSGHHSATAGPGHYKLNLYTLSVSPSCLSLYILVTSNIYIPIRCMVHVPFEKIVWPFYNSASCDISSWEYMKSTPCSSPPALALPQSVSAM